MKKIILTAAAVFAFSFANAQDLKSKKGEPYLPEAGDWGISFNADNLFNYVGNAFSGSTTKNEIGALTNSNKSGSFTGKKFKSANQADRYTVGFQLATSSETMDASPNPYGLDPGDKVAFTKLNLQVGIGKEWRRGKTRLQGFYGYDLVAGLDLVNSAKVTYEDKSPSDTLKNGVGFNVGAHGFLGAEYFIFPKIAIGASYTYAVDINIKGSGSEDESFTDPKIGGKGKSSGIDIGNVGVAAISLSLHF
jgi:hypothetical protein